MQEVPEENATDSEIEMAAVADQADEFLSHQELEYYMNLDSIP